MLGLTNTHWCTRMRVCVVVQDTAHEELVEVSHQRLHAFLHEDEAGLRLGAHGLRRGLRVALALPTGVTMWIALLQTMCSAVAVPVNVYNTAQVKSRQ
jgi:acyl-CoA synthetase (AMP-forming)/AMP-acid ligase II